MRTRCFTENDDSPGSLPVSWKLGNFPCYLEAEREDDYKCVPSVIVKGLASGHSALEDEEASSKPFFCTSSGDESIVSSSTPVNQRKDGHTECRDSCQQVGCFQSLKGPCETASVEAGPIVCEAVPAVSFGKSPGLTGILQCDDEENTHPAKPRPLQTSPRPRQKKEDDSFSEIHAFSASSENRGWVISKNKTPCSISVAEPDDSFDCDTVCMRPTVAVATATASAQTGRKEYLANQITTELFSDSFCLSALSDVDKRKKSSTDEDTFMHNTEKIAFLSFDSRSRSPCKQSTAEKQNKLFPEEGCLEILDTVQHSSSKSFPPCRLSVSEHSEEEDAFTLHGKSYLLASLQPPASQYFIPLQRSDTAFSDQPSHPPLLPSLLPIPALSDKPFPLFLPPLTPCEPNAAQHVSSCRTSPSSPPRNSGSILLCPSPPGGGTPAADEACSAICDLTEPPNSDLHKSLPFKESAWDSSSYTSVAGRCAPLTDNPGDSVVYVGAIEEVTEPTEAPGVAFASKGRASVDSLSSSTSYSSSSSCFAQGLLPSSTGHAATETPRLSCVSLHSSQFKPTEEANFSKCEVKSRAHAPNGNGARPSVQLASSFLSHPSDCEEKDRKRALSDGRAQPPVQPAGFFEDHLSKSEERKREQAPSDSRAQPPTQPAGSGEDHHELRAPACGSGLRSSKSETVAGLRVSHVGRQNASQLGEEDSFARTVSLGKEKDTCFMGERLSDVSHKNRRPESGDSPITRDAALTSASGQVSCSEHHSSSPPLKVKTPSSPTEVCALTLVEDEALPPLLLGRKPLLLPADEEKPFPDGCAAVPSYQPLQSFEQQTQFSLHDHRMQGRVPRHLETAGLGYDLKNSPQPDASPDVMQQVPPTCPANTSSSALVDLVEPTEEAKSTLPFLFSSQAQQPFPYACAGPADRRADFATDSADAYAHAIPQQALPLNTGRPYPLALPPEGDTKPLPVVGPPTLLQNFSFGFPNAYWSGNMQLTEPTASQAGQPIYGYPNALLYPPLACQRPAANSQDYDAATFATFTCGLPLPPPWLCETDALVSAMASTADILQPQLPPQPSLLCSRQHSESAEPCFPATVGVGPPFLHGASARLLLGSHHHHAGSTGELYLLPPSAEEATGAALPRANSQIYMKHTAAAPRKAGESARCGALRFAKSACRKRRMLQSCAPPEAAARDHKDYLLELLACSLEPVKGVHMDRLRKTWVASWLVGKRRVTRIFSFQKFGFFGAREQAIRQRREALLNPELESEEAQRIVAGAAETAAAAATAMKSPTTTLAGAAAATCSGTEEEGESQCQITSAERRLVQKIADSLPFVVGVTYHGESCSWIANHRKPMGKIVARRKFSIGELGFLEARRRAAVMMFHWHKQGRVVEPEDYDQGAAAAFNAQQRPQLPDAANTEGFVYWYPACTANEPLYLITAFNEEACDEAMVLLASICGNPWKKVCRGQPQGTGEDLLLVGGGDTAPMSRLVTGLHTDGARTNWYLSNSQKRDKNYSFWDALKQKGRHHRDSEESRPSSPRKRLKGSAAAKKSSPVGQEISSERRDTQLFRSEAVSPERKKHDACSRRGQNRALCRTESRAQRASEEVENGCWEEKRGSLRADTSCRREASYEKKHNPASLRHQVSVSGKIRERPQEIEKEVTLLQKTIRTRNAYSLKINTPFPTSTYWTRRKHAEFVGSRRDKSHTEVQDAAEMKNASSSREKGFHKAETQQRDTGAHEQPHSAQDVLRACFGSESASVLSSAAVSKEDEEAEAFVEAEEREREAEEEEEEPEEEEEEEEDLEDEEDDEKEEREEAGFLIEASAAGFSAGIDAADCGNGEHRFPSKIPVVGCRQPLLPQRSDRGLLNTPKGAEAVVSSKKCCDAVLLPAQQAALGTIIGNGATNFKHVPRLLDTTFWFTDGFLQYATGQTHGSQNPRELYYNQQNSEQTGDVSFPP